MIKHALERYDAYKDSGIEWLGEVPEHWQIYRIKDHTYVKGRIGWQGLRNSDFLYEGDFYCVTGTDLKNGIIDWSNCYYVSEKRYEQDKFIQLKVNDLLITKDGTIGKVALVYELPKKSTLNSGVFITRPLQNKYNNKYMYWVLCSSMFRNYIDLTKGGSTIQHLYQNVFERFSYPYPSLSTQKAIATYLNTKTTQIDRKIDLLTKKATKYGKLKQSLINETVTRGLDKTVALKDSGVDWLGDVPEHWKVNRLKNLAYIKTGGKDTIDNVEEGAYPFFVRSQTIERINSYSFDGEAILTAGDGVGVGKVFHHVNCKFDYHQRVYKISNFRGVVGRLVFYYMRENFHKDALRLNAKSTVDSLRMPMFQNFTIAFGDIEEQKAIADYLDTNTAHIDRIVETINTQIEKLKELRKTLINDVVTGKIKVA